MNDVLALQVVKCQCHLTEVEFDSILTELNTLLQVVAKISSQQEVHYHKHVLLVLERVPRTRERTQCSLTVQGGWEKHAIQTRTENTNALRSGAFTYKAYGVSNHRHMHGCRSPHRHIQRKTCPIPASVSVCLIKYH